MKKAHFFLALIVLVTFLISGIYMRLYFPDIYHDDQIIRASFRTTHIYILFNGLCHLLLGTFLAISEDKKRYVLQCIGFGLITLASVLLILGFFYQAIHGEDSLRRFGVIITAIGVLGHSLAKFREA